MEQKPLKVESLKGDAAEAAKRLQAVLGQFAEARPAHLRKP
jgi:hypothetical protein